MDGCVTTDQVTKTMIDMMKSEAHGVDLFQSFR
jgi:hypothetical protein